MEPRRARELWHLFEPVHAVTYFAPECAEGFAEIGLKGFWMGYFAGRAAPLGAVGPGTVTAAFYGFHPAKVARAIPDAWGLADPDVVLEARRRGAARALRRLCPTVDAEAARLVDLLGRLVAGAEGAGRVLFSANRDLGTPDDPVEALWQLTTCLREHRGDGHVATLCGLSPCQALVLFARSESIPDEMLRESRGWPEVAWDSAAASLRSAGLLGDTAISEAGQTLRASIETTTDGLAATLFAHATEADLAALTEGFSRLAKDINGQATIPYPNPMGLPAPERSAGPH